MPTAPAGSERFARSVPGDSQIESLRLPPHSVEAEQAVLGGLLLSNASWDKIGDLISESDFYRADHRFLWRTITALIEENKPADVLTVAEALKVSGELQDAGGLAYLHQLASGTPSAANIRRYAEIVRERAIMRKLAEVGTSIADSAYSPQGREARQLLDEAETRILEIGESGGRSSESFAKMSEVLAEVMSRLDELHRNPASVTGVASGFVDLDEMTTGLQPGDLIIVAGRPAMGKTSFALNIAEHVALDLKLPVLVFSMEMGGTQLATRLLGSVGKVDAQKLRTGRLDPGDWDRLGMALGKLNEAPLLIDETAALNPLELRARARRKWREYGGLGLIVIDYIQLMQATDAGQENRATELSEISRGLKQMAKELKVPVIALSQLNRSLEQRPNKRPVMSDLRECVTGDTPVVLADGSRVPVRELAGTRPQVLAMDGEGRIRPAESDCVWSVGVKPVLKVTLASGRTLRASANHRLYGPRGWVEVGELRPGSFLATARQRALREVVAPRPSVSPLEVLFTEGSANPPAGRTGAANEGQWDGDGGRHSDLHWELVVRVEPAGEEEVFDLTVPGPACWLADGIVSHNSGALEQDADMIFFIYRDEVYNEDSPDKGIAEIIIGKQRNGPIGTVKLTFLGRHTRFENYSGAPGY